MSPEILRCVAIDDLILILGYNRCGIFVKSTLVTWWPLEEWCVWVFWPFCPKLMVFGVSSYDCQIGALIWWFCLFVCFFFHLGLSTSIQLDLKTKISWYARKSWRMSGDFRSGKALWQSNQTSYLDGHSLKRSQFGKDNKITRLSFFGSCLFVIRGKKFQG